MMVSRFLRKTDFKYKKLIKANCDRKKKISHKFKSFIELLVNKGL